MPVPFPSLRPAPKSTPGNAVGRTSPNRRAAAARAILSARRTHHEGRQPSASDPVVEVRAEVRSDGFTSARFYDNRIFMKNSINDDRKIRRGRPATGTAPLVGV